MSYAGAPELSSGEQEQVVFGLQHRIADFLMIDPYDDELIEALQKALSGQFGVIADPGEPQAVLGRGNVEPLEPEIWRALEQDIDQPFAGQQARVEAFYDGDDTQLYEELIASGQPFRLSEIKDDDVCTETWYPLHDETARLPVYYCQTKPFGSTDSTNSCILLPNLSAIPPLETPTAPL